MCDTASLSLGYDERCHYISIGDNDIFEESPFKDAEKPSGDSFYIKTNANNIFINGGSMRSLYYGAYELLRQLGTEFYAHDCETMGEGATEPSKINVAVTPDIPIRAYLNYNTCYSGTDKDFVNKLGNNTSYSLTDDIHGGTVKFGYLGSDTHNARYYVGESYWGTDYCPANSLAVGGYVPCLTNGVDYNTDSTSTLSLVEANMKKLILANPSLNYFTFEQEDGPDGAYCTCEHCVAATAQYGRSGVQIRFINALLAKLRTESDLSERSYKIVTFAYSYTASAPQNVSIDKDICVWYAASTDARYSLLDDNQMESYRTNLSGWKDLTSNADSGSMILWLYDVSFNNYLSYFGTSMTAIDETIEEAVSMNTEMLLVQGAYDADNIWQSEMKSYVWSRKMVNKNLKAKDLRDAFLNAYFGEASEYIKSYCDDYDSYYSSNDKYYPVCHGYEYYSRPSVSNHCSSLKRVNSALDAISSSTTLSDEAKATYTKRLNSVKASSMASLLYYYDTYYKAAALSSEQKQLMGGGLLVSSDTAKAAFIESFKTVCSNAGITRCREGVDSNNTVEDFLNNSVAKKY